MVNWNLPSSAGWPIFGVADELDELLAVLELLLLELLEGVDGLLLLLAAPNTLITTNARITDRTLCRKNQFFFCGCVFPLVRLVNARNYQHNFS